MKSHPSTIFVVFDKQILYSVVKNPNWKLAWKYDSDKYRFLLGVDHNSELIWQFIVS